MFTSSYQVEKNLVGGISLPVETILSLSSHHLPYKEEERLVRGLVEGLDTVNLPGTGGVMIDTSTFTSDLMEEVSHELGLCVNLARRAGCRWLCFSEEAEKLSFLSIFRRAK